MMNLGAGPERQCVAELMIISVCFAVSSNALVSCRRRNIGARSGRQQPQKLS